MNPSIRRILNTLGPFLGLLAVVLIFSIKPDVRSVFLTGGNFKIILTQTVIVAIGALGMTLIIVSGGIDLSVGATIALTGVITALGMSEKTRMIAMRPSAGPMRTIQRRTMACARSARSPASSVGAPA